MRKPKQWDDEATYGTDPLGIGSYQFNASSGKTKFKNQIGFVRDDRNKRKARPNSKGKRYKAGRPRRSAKAR